MQNNTHSKAITCIGRRRRKINRDPQSSTNSRGTTDTLDNLVTTTVDARQNKGARKMGNQKCPLGVCRKDVSQKDGMSLGMQAEKSESHHHHHHQSALKQKLMNTVYSNCYCNTMERKQNDQKIPLGNQFPARTASQGSSIACMWSYETTDATADWVPQGTKPTGVAASQRNRHPSWKEADICK